MGKGVFAINKSPPLQQNNGTHQKNIALFYDIALFSCSSFIQGYRKVVLLSKMTGKSTK